MLLISCALYPHFCPQLLFFPVRVSALELPTQNARISVQISRQQTMTLKAVDGEEQRGRGRSEAKTTSCNFLFYIFNGILSNAINRNCSFTHAHTLTHTYSIHMELSQRSTHTLSLFLPHTQPHINATLRSHFEALQRDQNKLPLDWHINILEFYVQSNVTNV